MNTQDEKYKNLSSQLKMETNTPIQFNSIHDILHTQVVISRPFLTICRVQQLPAKTWIIIYPSLETDNLQLFYFRRQFEHNGVE